MLKDKKLLGTEVFVMPTNDGSGQFHRFNMPQLMDRFLGTSRNSLIRDVVQNVVHGDGLSHGVDPVDKLTNYLGGVIQSLGIEQQLVEVGVEKVGVRDGVRGALLSEKNLKGSVAGLLGTIAAEPQYWVDFYDQMHLSPLDLLVDLSRRGLFDPRKMAPEIWNSLHKRDVEARKNASQISSRPRVLLSAPPVQEVDPNTVQVPKDQLQTLQQLAQVGAQVTRGVNDKSIKIVENKQEQSKLWIAGSVAAAIVLGWLVLGGGFNGGSSAASKDVGRTPTPISAPASAVDQEAPEVSTDENGLAIPPTQVPGLRPKPTPVRVEAPTVTSQPQNAGALCDYTVVAGDGLYKIAREHSVDLNALLSQNGLTLNSIIQVGQKIVMPGCAK